MLIGTALAEELDRELGNKQGAPDYKMDLKDLSQGTATHVVAAFDPKLEGTVFPHAYCLTCRV